MTDTNKVIEELQSASKWFAEHGRNTNTAIIGICERAVDLIKLQKKEINRLNFIMARDEQRKAEKDKDEQHALCVLDDLLTESYKENKKLKAEIEELTLKNERQRHTIKVYHIGETRNEAIKEFAERLKANITINNTEDGYLNYSVDYNCLMDDIDDLVKEMVGEQE